MKIDPNWITAFATVATGFAAIATARLTKQYVQKMDDSNRIAQKNYEENLAVRIQAKLLGGSCSSVGSLPSLSLGNEPPLLKVEYMVRLTNFGRCPVRITQILVTHPNFPRSDQPFSSQCFAFSRLLQVQDYWEQGFSFLVDHPDNADPIFLQVSYEDPLHQGKMTTIDVPIDGQPLS